MAVLETISSWFQRGREAPALPHDWSEGHHHSLARRRSRRANGDDSSDFPTFRATAIDRPQVEEESEDILRARFLLRDIFTPAQPVTDRTRFAGRLDLLAKLIGVIEEQRSHLVIYGERGIGKTSVVHILAGLARESQYLVAYASCGANSQFGDIFRSLLSSVPLLYLNSVAPTALEAEGGRTLADILPEGTLDGRQVADVCSQLTGTRLLIFLDEYDRVETPGFRQSVAELIKDLSDRSTRVQLVLTGVSSSLKDLIGYIPSIRRNIVGVPMPKLTGDEVYALVRIGEDAAGVSFDDKVVQTITLLAHGSPYLARLLIHHSAMHALGAQRLTIESVDLAAALAQAVEEAEQRIDPDLLGRVSMFLAAHGSDFIGATARASATAEGWFRADEVDRMLQGDGTEGSAPRLETLAENGDLIQRQPHPAGTRYRFIDEGLPTYLWLRIAHAQSR